MPRKRSCGEPFGDADLVGFHLPMHTATRLAAPIIAARAARQPRGAHLRVRSLRAAQRAMAAIDRRRRSVRRRVRGGSRAWARDGGRGLQAGRAATLPGPRLRQRRHCRRIHFLVPDRAALPPLSHTRRCRCPTGRGGSSATPKRAAAASISAAIARSCRSTTGSSASCSRRSCSRMSRRRSPPAPRTSRSAIPTSSTARRTRCASSTALHAAHPAVSYDVTIKIEHLLQHRDLLPRLAAHRLRVRDQRGRIGGRSRARASSTRDTRAPISSRRSRSAATPGVTLVPTFVAFHPWLTLAGTAICSTRSRRSISSTTWRRFSSRSGC